MQGLLRGSSMDQRWQELASLLSLQPPPHHDGNGGPLPPSLPHAHFPPHHHHHHHHHHHPALHHTGTPLHPHAMHHPSFTSAGPPTAPYNADSARSVLLQNATLPPPDLSASSPYPSVGMGKSCPKSAHYAFPPWVVLFLVKRKQSNKWLMEEINAYVVVAKNEILGCLLMGLKDGMYPSDFEDDLWGICC